MVIVLPENVTPISYDMKFVTNVSTDFTYNRVVSIDVKVEENKNNIVLHSNNLNILLQLTCRLQYDRIM